MFQKLPSLEQLEIKLNEIGRATKKQEDAKTRREGKDEEKKYIRGERRKAQAAIRSLKR